MARKLCDFTHQWLVEVTGKKKVHSMVSQAPNINEMKGLTNGKYEI